MTKLIKILCSTLTIFTIIIFVGAYFTLKCEQTDASANIKTYQDALWWSLNASSIGDSNVYPVTIPGRIVGAFLIVIGYGLFTINVGTISAGLVHLLKERNKESAIEFFEEVFDVKKRRK